MHKYFINNNSDKLLLFFTGWGCDEFEFEHLHSNSDILILYDYSNSNLNLDFNFSKYKEINLIAFSAGVFIASILDFYFKINKKIAISGNPYLFDEHFGLSKDIQNVLYNITEKNADDFARNYLIKTDTEWKKFRHSQRTLDSCKAEFNSLKELYKVNKKNIKDIFDNVLFGADDTIFDLFTQKEFYGEKLHVIKNARHNIFFKINQFEEIFDLSFN